ncbi:MAG: homocysteine S-methyltransferase [Actinomycetota bacterium]
MATDVAERFQGPLVLDGGMANELERGGADLRDALWSARLLKDDPGSIRRVHEAFFNAGADVAISASYQASFSGFADHGIEAEEAASLMRLSVALAREAAAADGSDRLVAASVGPFGATLADGSEYRGDYGLSAGALAMFHRPRFETLLEAEPDLLAIETIPSIVEAEALVTLLEDYPEARAWISFSCRDGACISDGTPFADAVALAASSDRVIAVGVNCTPPGFIPSLLDGAETTKPLLAYPNVGSTWDAASRSWILEGERPDPGASAITWRSAGATIVGGCCGTTPDDIRAIAASA